VSKNPQNNLPEPLGTIIIVANFCLGVWNAYSNNRQEKKQAIYDRHQREIITLLESVKNNIGGEENENAD
jgi:uncharacterized membrane protein YvbJ